MNNETINDLFYCFYIHKYQLNFCNYVFTRYRTVTLNESKLYNNFEYLLEV